MDSPGTHSGLASLRNGRFEIAAAAMSSRCSGHLQTHTRYPRRRRRRRRRVKKGVRRSRRRPSMIKVRDGGRRRDAHGTSFGSLRRAAANGADAIPPNGSSRSIEVHGRKQAPFYPVHSRQRERWTDGAVHRARDATGRERVYALLSRAVSRSRSPPPPLAHSLTHPLSLSLSLSLARHSTYRRESRIAAPCTYDHPKNSPEGSPRRGRYGDYFTTFDARTGLSPLSHCRLYFTAK